MHSISAFLNILAVPGNGWLLNVWRATEKTALSPTPFERNPGPCFSERFSKACCSEDNFQTIQIPVLALKAQ
jgi:hypothetical protein